jgi:DNA-binding beta-propeller fold protein YncE
VPGAEKIAVDAQTGKIYVLTRMTLEGVDPTDGKVTTVIHANQCGYAGFGRVGDVRVHPTNGTIYMSFPDHRIVVNIGEDGRRVEVLNDTILYGRLSPACFFRPTRLAFDAAGKLYVTDPGNNRILRVTPEGDVTTLPSSGLPGDRDGGRLHTQFDSPSGVAVDAKSNVLVQGWNHPIRRVTPEGGVTTLDAEKGWTGVCGTVRVHPNGTVYFLHSLGRELRKVDAGGVVSTLAKTGDTIDGMCLGRMVDFEIMPDGRIVLVCEAKIVFVDDSTIGLRR